MDDDSALSYCAEQVRVHDDDRFLCALFAPEPARKGLLALYAFNLEIARIREVVSEPMPRREPRSHVRSSTGRRTLDARYLRNL